MILEHLSGDYRANTSNIVDVYIRYLRNKLDRGFDRQLIHTRWGEGYVMQGEIAPERLLRSASGSGND